MRTSQNFRQITPASSNRSISTSSGLFIFIRSSIHVLLLPAQRSRGFCLPSAAVWAHQKRLWPQERKDIVILFLSYSMIQSFCAFVKQNNKQFSARFDLSFCAAIRALRGPGRRFSPAGSSPIRQGFWEPDRQRKGRFPAGKRPGSRRSEQQPKLTSCSARKTRSSS